MTMFKKAAAKKIEETNSNEQLELSLKYQVLCSQTAYFAQIKQKKATGELQEIDVVFGTEKITE